MCMQRMTSAAASSIVVRSCYCTLSLGHVATNFIRSSPINITWQSHVHVHTHIRYNIIQKFIFSCRIL